LSVAIVARQRAAKARLGLVEILKRGVDGAQMVVVRRLGVVDRDGLLDGLGGLGVAARLMGGQAGQVPGVGMARIDRQDLPVELLGLGELAALVMVKCDRKCLTVLIGDVARRCPRRAGRPVGEARR
jgi:hypothetical protein